MIVLIAGNVAVVPRRNGSAHRQSTPPSHHEALEVCAQPSGPQPIEPVAVISSICRADRLAGRGLRSTARPARAGTMRCHGLSPGQE